MNKNNTIYYFHLFSQEIHSHQFETEDQCYYQSNMVKTPSLSWRCGNRVIKLTRKAERRKSSNFWEEKRET